MLIRDVPEKQRGDRGALQSYDRWSGPRKLDAACAGTTTLSMRSGRPKAKAPSCFVSVASAMISFSCRCCTITGAAFGTRRLVDYGRRCGADKLTQIKPPLLLLSCLLNSNARRDNVGGSTRPPTRTKRTKRKGAGLASLRPHPHTLAAKQTRLLE